ncbi:MAG: cytochrome c oxidase assembly protein [Gemmatimonadaceae bacterium]
MIEPGTALPIGAAALGYAAGVRRLWRHAGGARGIDRRQLALFAAGILALVVALLSPLDTMADDLFSAHMVQHMLLAIVAPPLLVAGEPLTAWVWVIPERVRADAARYVRRCAAAGAAIATPAAVCAAHAVAIWMWHAPRLYEAALRDERVHAIEHLSFLGTGMLLWWRIMPHGRPSRRGFAAGILIVFATMMQTGLLGALLTLSRRPWYSIHAATTARWGLTVLEDQQLAGLIMWVGGGLFYVVVMSILFVEWLDHFDVRRMGISGDASGLRPAASRDHPSLRSG